VYNGLVSGSVERGDAPAGEARRSGRRGRLSPLAIVLLYAAFGVAWILTSDKALALVVRDEARREALATAKGTCYVVVTATLLFVLIRRNERARRTRDEEVRTVLDGMADAVLVVRGDGVVLDVNAAAVELFAANEAADLLLPAAELWDRLHLRRTDGSKVPYGATATRRALDGEVVPSYDARVRTLDGREALVSVSAAPVGSGARDARGARAVVVVRDVGEVQQFEEMREEFLATAAHELRTPLAVVKAYAQLMHKRGDGDPAALEVIARQIDRLTRIVQQLLDVSRFRVGGAELRRERFDISALVAEIAQAAEAGAEGCRILVVTRAPAEVVGDRERIGQVVASLLDNAVRFSPTGGDVETAVERRGQEAVVSVRDHGLGIAPERQGRIFERFYRAHAGTAHDYGGLGLGLDMSKEIVSRHGGRIGFRSEPGQGSTFWFALPLAPEHRA